MIALFMRSVSTTVLLAVLLCGVYPLIVTGIGKVFFPANGVDAGIIGQSFTRPEYFHGRPSAAGEKGYDGASSSGSNLGPTSKKLEDRIKSDVDSVLKENPSLKHGQIPVDMVTASASGLDPHISPENAFAQAARVANARGMNLEEINKVIDRHIEGPQLGIFGESVVNVLTVNRDLDRLKKENGP